MGNSSTKNKKNQNEYEVFLPRIRFTKDSDIDKINSLHDCLKENFQSFLVMKEEDNLWYGIFNEELTSDERDRLWYLVSNFNFEIERDFYEEEEEKEVPVTDLVEIDNKNTNQNEIDVYVDYEEYNRNLLDNLQEKEREEARIRKRIRDWSIKNKSTLPVFGYNSSLTHDTIAGTYYPRIGYDFNRPEHKEKKEEEFNYYEYELRPAQTERYQHRIEEVKEEKQIVDEETDIEELQCTICLTYKKCMMFEPCNHLCVCNECSKNINECPMCRSKFTNVKYIFL